MSEWRLGPFRKRRKSEEIIFGQVREDYSYEAGLAQGSVLCIASGGDLAFEALSRNANEVTAIDVNLAQIHLVELKRQALCLSDYGDVLQCFASDARRGYSKVRPSLSPECARFFDNRQDQLSKGLQNCGAADRVIRRLASLFGRILRSESDVREFLTFTNLEDQMEFFMKRWNDWRWRFAFRSAFNPLSLKLVLGRMFSDAINNGFADDFRGAFDEVFQTVPNGLNPFVWQALEGRFPPGVLPFWLSEEGWGNLGPKLENLTFQVADLKEHLDHSEPGQYDLICLTNILDVVPAGYVGSLAMILKGCCLPRNQIVSRSFFEHKKLTSELVAAGFSVAEIKGFTDRSFFCRNIEHLIVDDNSQLSDIIETLSCTGSKGTR